MRTARYAKRRGEQAAAVLLLLACLAPIGAADEDSTAQVASQSPVVQALEAQRRSSDHDLRIIAQRAGSQVWELVEDLLIEPEGALAAKSLARLWIDPDQPALVRYVAARHGKAHASEMLKALERAHAAIRAKHYAGAAILLKSIRFDPETVSSIRVLALLARLLQFKKQAEESVDLHLQAADLAQRIGWRSRAGEFLSAVMHQAGRERDYATARRAGDRRYNLLRSRGDADAAAACLADVATTCARQSDFPCARKLYAKAIRALTKVGQERNAAITRGNLGLLHQRLGELERSLTHLEGALAVLRRVGTENDVAETLSLLGHVRAETGQFERALLHQNEALAIMRASAKANPNPSRQESGTLAMVLGNTAYATMLLGDLDKAQAYLLEAIDIFEHTLKDAYLVAVAMADLAELTFRQGDLVSASAQVHGALHHFDTIGSERDVTKHRVLQGRIFAARSMEAEAEKSFESAQAAGKRLRLYGVVVDAMTEHAALCLRAGRLDQAGELAFGAVDLLGSSLAHLADGEGAEARQRRLRTYQMPIRVALASGDVEDATEALDEARAGTFLEAMGGRVAVREAAMPTDVLRRLRAAQEREAHAWSQGQRAQAIRSLSRRRDAAKRLETARKQTEAAHEAAQRTARHAADTVYPRADELATIQKELAPTDALVLYGLLAEESVALVITRKGADLRHLPSEKAIAKACEGLLLEHAPFIDASKSADLRAAVIDPLRLGAKIRRVLVSPDGILTYVPFSLLLPELAIAYVPSATSYRALREAKNLRGTGVVAFGDPAYRRMAKAATTPQHRGLMGWSPSRLKASGDEARAVGTRGRVFVGTDATEANLRAAVAPNRKRRRIRSLHLAGHGRADAEHPHLSCIALAPSGHDDGFLMGREVMGLQIDADLVVLSACESVRGKVVRGEGLQGLTRAFMFAGAPRVLASLWNVDDEATKVFMVKFYELWKGSTGAAEALRLTQEHMRTKTKWKAPEHWAAWVLWGLPD